MKKHYHCEHRTQGEDPLVFDWDQEAGEISGPSAERILEYAACRSVPIYPPPQDWDFGPDPLKNKYDMAAIIAYQHELPDDLAEYYPGRFTPEPEDGVIY